MKKYLLIILTCILLCSIVGVVIYCLSPEEEKLKVSISDVSVNVGQKVKLEYSTSIEDAVITFTLENEDIAKINQEGKDVYVTGIEEGTTSLKVIARYKVSREEVGADVVVKKDVATSNPISEPDDENVNDSEEDNENNSLTPTPPENPTSTQLELTFDEDNFVNFSIEGNVMTIKKSKKAKFSVTSNIMVSKIEGISADISVEIKSSIFTLFSDKTGTFELSIVVNDIHSKTYTVNVI